MLLLLLAGCSRTLQNRKISTDRQTDRQLVRTGKLYASVRRSVPSVRESSTSIRVDFLRGSSRISARHGRALREPQDVLYKAGILQRG